MSFRNSKTPKIKFPKLEFLKLEFLNLNSKLEFPKNSSLVFTAVTAKFKGQREFRIP